MSMPQHTLTDGKLAYIKREVYYITLC